MTAVNAVALAIVMMMPLPCAAQALDTPTAARALVPLLKGVQQRLQPRVGVGRGEPLPSPFTGTMTTIVSFGISKKEVPVDPKVVKAIEQLQAWKIDGQDQTAEAVLFDHWLTQLTVKAAHVGLLNCDAACVVEKFTKPDQAFGRTEKEREERRDELLLEALADAVEEIGAR